MPDVAKGATLQISIDEAAARIAPDAELRSVPLFEHGTLLLKYYAPRRTDHQTPHTRDEIYVVARGEGVFWNGSTRRRDRAG